MDKQSGCFGRSVSASPGSIWSSDSIWFAIHLVVKTLCLVLWRIWQYHQPYCFGVTTADSQGSFSRIRGWKRLFTIPGRWNWLWSHLPTMVWSRPADHKVKIRIIAKYGGASLKYSRSATFQYHIATRKFLENIETALTAFNWVDLSQDSGRFRMLTGQTAAADFCHIPSRCNAWWTNLTVPSKVNWKSTNSTNCTS